MQIHEITQVNEGLLDLAKRAAGGVRGAVQGYQQAKTTRNIRDVANRALKIWNQYAQNLKMATADPARYKTLYQQALTAFVQKNLLKGMTIDSSINRQEITDLIRSISAAEANPQQVAVLFPRLIQQATLAQPDTGRVSQSLAKVISTQPAVIQYRNINYAINDNGDWANQATGKVPDESFQAFLDQELAKAGG